MSVVVNCLPLETQHVNLHVNHVLLKLQKLCITHYLCLIERPCAMVVCLCLCIAVAIPLPTNKKKSLLESSFKYLFSMGVSHSKRCCVGHRPSSVCIWVVVTFKLKQTVMQFFIFKWYLCEPLFLSALGMWRSWTARPSLTLPMRH